MGTIALDSDSGPPPTTLPTRRSKRFDRLLGRRRRAPRLARTETNSFRRCPRLPPVDPGERDNPLPSARSSRTILGNTKRAAGKAFQSSAPRTLLRAKSPEKVGASSDATAQSNRSVPAPMLPSHEYPRSVQVLHSRSRQRYLIPAPASRPRRNARGSGLDSRSGITFYDIRNRRRNDSRNPSSPRFLSTHANRTFEACTFLRSQSPKLDRSLSLTNSFTIRHEGTPNTRQDLCGSEKETLTIDL